MAVTMAQADRPPLRREMPSSPVGTAVLLPVLAQVSMELAVVRQATPPLPVSLVAM
jgi:hypothetical protein